MSNETGTVAQTSSCCAPAPVAAEPVATSSCCSSTPASANPAAQPSGATNLLDPSAADNGMAVCPVMAGTPVVKAVAEASGLFRDYQGERYWFCCAACGPLFDADPSRYATAA